MPPSSGGENVVLVAVRAEGEVSKTALAWALTHVVRPGDLVTLLAVLPDLHDSRGGWRRMLRGFPRFNSAADARRRERRCQISASCSQMALQIDGHSEINVRIKVVGQEEERSPGGGVVVAESKRVGADWVVLDKQLKQEEKHCMEELQCNIVAMKGSHARVLRLNLGEPQRPCLPASSSSCALTVEPSEIFSYNQIIKNSLSNSSKGRSSAYVCGNNPLFSEVQNKKLMMLKGTANLNDFCAFDSDVSSRASPLYANPAMEFGRDGGHTDSCRGHPKSNHYYSASGSYPSSQSHHRDGVYWIPEYIPEDTPIARRCKSNEHSNKPPATARTLKEEFSEHDRKSLLRKLRLHQYLTKDHTYMTDVREAVSLHGRSPSIPPPLCSLCRHKAPLFGKPPRRFTYQELEEATHGFSNENLLAEGWSGRVHRGMLKDGRAVAVKQLKTTGQNGLDGMEEFLAEVEVLSRAQHRNVVMLVGFCIEENMRVLVYEYICNGSLNLHLHGREKAPLDWHARVKIAVGVARGLRYLHEDCRVGFVVHRDIRPNNILLTHDFDPMVGDLSVTRCRMENSPCVDTYLPQTFGYLAPEYIEYGIETEKADVYAFGVVLLELITGRRAMDASRPKGQQFLAEWARPLLSLAAMEGQNSTVAVDRFLDPRLDQAQTELSPLPFRSMACAASLCLRREPQTRPTMSKVLRVLEGNASVDLHFSADSIGSRSGRMGGSFPRKVTQMEGSISLRFPNEVVSDVLCADKNWPLIC